MARISDSTVDSVRRRLLDAYGEPLGTLVPALHRDEPVDCLRLANRSANALLRASIATCRDLAGWSLSQIHARPSVGTGTIDDIVDCLARWAAAGLVSEADTDEAGAEHPALVEPVVKVMRDLAAWAVLCDGPATVGELITLAEDISLPKELAHQWTELSARPLRELASLEAGEGLQAALADLLQGFDERERFILERRVLAAAPRTLQDLSADLNVTRERVRQVQVRVEAKLRAELTAARYAVLRWRAEQLGAILGVAAPTDHPATRTALARAGAGVSDQHDLAIQLMLYAAGPYYVSDGWLLKEGAAEPDADGPLKFADEHGLVPLGKVSQWLTESGVVQPFHQPWLEACRYRLLDTDTLADWAGNVADKCVRLLAWHGAPLDPTALNALVGEGHSLRGTRNQLFQDERLMRVGRNSFALRCWGGEEYSGITDEMQQRIEAAGGRVRLDWLVDALADEFDVRPASVRAYAEAPLFVLEHGSIRMRRPDEPYPVRTDLTRCRGVFKTGPQRVSMLIGVDADVLRGSGRSVPQPVAAVLRLQPGESAEFTGQTATVTMTWPTTASAGPSLGSVRRAAESVFALEGDQIRIELDGSAGSLTVVRVPAGLVATDSAALELLTGISAGDSLEALGRALGVDASAVRGVLAARGDDHVLRCLPRPQVDPHLGAALTDLAQLLDDLA